MPPTSKISEPSSNNVNLGNPRLSRQSKGAVPLISEMGEMDEPLSNRADLGATMFVDEGLLDPTLLADSLIHPSPDDGEVVSRLEAMELRDVVA
ncbi:hypothetical protein Ancab_010695 [Ancistrocladus abbreviatus]